MKAVRVPCGECPWLGPCLGLCWDRWTPRCGAQWNTAALHGRTPNVGAEASLCVSRWPDGTPTPRPSPECSPP